MAQRYFYGKDQAWLEAKLNTAYDAQASGQRYIKVESAGNTGEKQRDLSIDEVISRLLNDLSLLDPDNYPPADIRRVTRTQMTAYGPQTFV